MPPSSDPSNRSAAPARPAPPAADPPDARTGATGGRAAGPGAAPPTACVTCGAALTGPWCAACGERVLRPDEHRLTAFVRDAAAGALDVDSRLWRSLRAVVRHPGFLTAEYIAGRRRPYLRPLQLFLLANLVFFLALSANLGVNTFTTPVRYHIGQLVYGEVAEELVARHGAPGSEERAAWVARFDRTAEVYANTLVIVFVPLLALMFALLYGLRRPFVHHLVLALHFCAFMLLAMLAIPVVALTLALVSPELAERAVSDRTITITFLALFTLYLSVAFRRVFGDGPWVAGVRGLLGALAFVPVITVYRGLLFFAVYFAVN